MRCSRPVSFRWMIILCCISSYPAFAQAESPVFMTQFEGAIQVRTGETVPLTLKGDAPGIGKFNAIGEIFFTPGQTAGSLVGHGIIACRTTDGDTLVGEIRWNLSPVQAGHRLVVMQFNWKGSVKDSDGMTWYSTGRFANSRPSDMTAQGIIAILIGLLVPVGS